jgi:hypothetical protein
VATASTLNNSAWWRGRRAAAAALPPPAKAGLKCNLGLMLFRTCVRCPLPGGGYIYRKKVEAKKEEEKKSRTQTVRKLECVKDTRDRQF